MRKRQKKGSLRSRTYGRRAAADSRVRENKSGNVAVRGESGSRKEQNCMNSERDMVDSLRTVCFRGAFGCFLSVCASWGVWW
jgi:hypothetical protein